MATFTPPHRYDVPPVLPDTPDWQKKPAIWNRTGLIPRCANVWKLLNGTYTETQPVSNEPWTSGSELYTVVYLGGHSYTVSAAEAAALTAAGYGSSIT